ATAVAGGPARVHAGFNFIDTADVYSRWATGHSGGESETVIGKWLQQSGKRDKVVLATKVGMDMGDGKVGLKPAYLRQAVEDSLRRLQVDCIDLYQSHQDDADTPVEETLAAYADLIRVGKVRAVGASNFTAARLGEALAASRTQGLPRYDTLQPLYNLYDRAGFEAELQALCVQEGVSVISFYALAAGFLTGKYRTAADAAKSARGKGTTAKYLNPRGLAILAALDSVSARVGATPGQVAVAWLLTRPGVTAPIASATSLEQLAELVAATRLVLDAEALAALEKASAPA
ncbi:MAG: aldo/keto reductase, partial [Comamonadaceae bacterium]